MFLLRGIRMSGTNLAMARRAREIYIRPRGEKQSVHSRQRGSRNPGLSFSACSTCLPRYRVERAVITLEIRS